MGDTPDNRRTHTVISQVLLDNKTCGYPMD
jgi:hypothetical protein